MDDPQEPRTKVLEKIIAITPGQAAEGVEVVCVKCDAKVTALVAPKGLPACERCFNLALHLEEAAAHGFHFGI